MRLRQIAFVAERLAPAVDELREGLGVEVCYRDDEVGKWGLENAVFPVGGDFLEIVAPVGDDTSAGRYLQRRGGDGGYMVILQCADAVAERDRITALGARVIWQADRPNYRATHFHPADAGGVLLSVDSIEPGADYRAVDCAWAPAGPDWQAAVRTDMVRALTGVELQSEAADALAARWSALLDRPSEELGDGRYRIALENADIRFASATDGRGAGIGAIDVKAAGDRAGGQKIICGTRVNFV